MIECWLSVVPSRVDFSFSSPAVTPLSSTVGHVQSTPSLWSVVPFLLLVAGFAAVINEYMF